MVRGSCFLSKALRYGKLELKSFFWIHQLCCHMVSGQVIKQTTNFRLEQAIQLMSIVCVVNSFFVIQNPLKWSCV